MSEKTSAPFSDSGVARDPIAYTSNVELGGVEISTSVTEAVISHNNFRFAQVTVTLRKEKSSSGEKRNKKCYVCVVTYDPFSGVSKKTCKEVPCDFFPDDLDPTL